MKLEFIRHKLNVEADGLRHMNHYIVYAMYNRIHDEGWADVKSKVVEKFSISWDEMEKRGCPDVISKELRKKYNIPKGL